MRWYARGRIVFVVMIVTLVLKVVISGIAIEIPHAYADNTCIVWHNECTLAPDSGWQAIDEQE